MKTTGWNNLEINGLQWKTYEQSDPGTYPNEGQQVRVRLSDGRMGPATFSANADSQFSLFNFPWGPSSPIVAWADWKWHVGFTAVKSSAHELMLNDEERAGLVKGDEVFSWIRVVKPGRHFAGVAITNPDTGLKSCRIEVSPLRASIGESKATVDQMFVYFNTAHPGPHNGL